MLYLFAGMCTMQWVSLGPGDKSSGPPQRRSHGESQAALCSMARKGLQYPMYLRRRKYPEVNQSVWKMHSSFLTLHFPQCPPPDQTQLCPATSSLGARTPRVSMAVSTRGLLSHHIWQNGTDLTQCPQTDSSWSQISPAIVSVPSSYTLNLWHWAGFLFTVFKGSLDA